MRARDSGELLERAARGLERSAGVLPSPEAGDGDERCRSGEGDAEPDDEVEETAVAIVAALLGRRTLCRRLHTRLLGHAACEGSTSIRCALVRADG